MAIRFRHDAAGVVPPSNASTRKYGQSLVLQQNQQKYQGQQAGYDRLFDAYKQQNQNAFAWNQAADNRVFQADQQQAQNNFQLGRDKTRFEQQQQEAEAERQRKFMDDARKMSSGMIMDDIKNGAYNTDTANKLQQNLVKESEALGNPTLDATQRAEALALIRAERALLTANRIEKPPQAPPQPNFHTDKNGNQWVESGPGKWEQVPQPAPAPPATPAEAFKAEPEIGDKYREKAEARLMGADGEMPQVESGEVGEDGKKKKRNMTPQELQREVNKLAADLWGIDNPQPAAPTGFGTSSAAYYNAPDSEAKLPAAAPAGIPITPPDSGQPPSPVPSQNPWAEMAGAEQQPQKPVTLEEVAYQPKPPAKPTGQRDANGYAIMDDGSKSDPRDAYAMKGTGVADAFNRLTNPDGTKKEPPKPTGEVDGQGYVIMSNGSKADPRDAYAMKGGGMSDSLNRTTNPDGSPVERQGGITLQLASQAAQQYEGAAQELQSLQSQQQTIEQQIRAASATRGSNPRKSARLQELKKERERVKAALQSTQQSMQQADKTARSYYDQEIAKQPASQKLAKAGKRPQDFAEAEFQLQNLRKQYPDMGSMPADAKKKLKEAMAVIQSGR